MFFEPNFEVFVWDNVTYIELGVCVMKLHKMYYYIERNHMLLIQIYPHLAVDYQPQ